MKPWYLREKTLKQNTLWNPRVQDGTSIYISLLNFQFYIYIYYIYICIYYYITCSLRNTCMVFDYLDVAAFCDSARFSKKKTLRIPEDSDHPGSPKMKRTGSLLEGFATFIPYLEDHPSGCN